MGMRFVFGPSRTARLMLLTDRVAVGAWIDKLCAWEFSRIVPAHGDPLDAGPSELRAAFAEWSG